MHMYSSGAGGVTVIVTELHKFEANIQVLGSRATVYGKGKASPFHSSQVNANDLRGGISLVLASLSAEGITEISGTSHADRGYENLEMKLQGLSANAIRITTTTYSV
uniref:UDP-N-acetylglucosamine 1-carboxyvinyltransferase n=1 Tax=Solanum lycopersicum TaxID=4081 RepID=K4D6K6_SOLLC